MRRRWRNPWFGLVGLILGLYVFVHIFYVRPWFFHFTHPVDPHPQAWGSSATYSTNEGFLLGKWISHLDPATARYRNDIAEFVIRADTECLEFQRSSRFIWRDGRHTVKGSWVQESQGIVFKPETVDDVNAQLAMHRFEGQRSLPPESDQYNQTWLHEGQAVDSVQRLGPLALMPDSKRLYRAGTANSSGTTFMGTIIWDRVRS